MAGLDQVRAELTRARGARSAVRFLAALLVPLFAACERSASTGGSGAASETPPPDRVVDSLLPPGEALRRFRAGLDTPASLDGPRTRDELVRRFLRAVRDRDRPALESLSVSRAEFAFLVFPELKVSKPPYRQPPEIAWLLTQSATDAGLTKLLGRADRFQLEGVRCSDDSRSEGEIRIWAGCTVQLREAGGELLRDARLFGAIIERGGRYKFAGFANDL